MKLQNNFFFFFKSTLTMHAAWIGRKSYDLVFSFFFKKKTMQNAWKGRKGKSFCTKNTGHCFDMVEYRRGVVLGGVSKLTTIQKFW